MTEKRMFDFKRNLFYSGLFYTLASFSLLAFLFITYQSSSKFIGKEFSGFLVSKNLLVSEFNLPSWESFDGNPLPGHRLLAVNQQPVRTIEQLRSAIEKSKKDERIAYTFESFEGERYVERFSLREFSGNEYYLTYGIVAYAVGFIILSMLIAIPFSPLNWRFSMWLYGFFSTIWLLGSFDFYTFSLYRTSTILAGACLIPSSLLFNITLCDGEKVSKGIKRLIPFSYAISLASAVVFLIVAVDGSRFAQIMNVIIWVNASFWALTVISYLAIRFKQRRGSDHVRQRILLLLISQLGFYGLPLFLMLCAHIFGINLKINQFLFVFSLFPLTVLYLCYSEKMMDKIRRVEEAKNREDRFVSLGVLSSGLAHEINNPLQILSLHTHAMQLNLQKFIETKNGLFEEKLKNNSEKIIKSLDRIYRVVESMDAFTKGNLKVEPKVNLRTIIEDCIEEAGERSRSKNISFDLSLMEVEQIVAATGVLTQVLSNIIYNAVDAINDEGSIEISSKFHDNNLKIKIRDDGPGIDPVVLRHIFEPFFTTKQPGEGMGLGLWIASQLMAAQGGRIIAYCPKSGGTVFEVIYPQVNLVSANQEQFRTQKVSKHF